MQAPHPAGWFVGAMEEWQQELGMSHQEFAAYLERGEGWWSRVRNGRRNLPLAIVRRVLRERPDFQAYVLLDLVGNGRSALDGAG